jgi:enoyl-CoA hydratase/carnithine racemase
MFEGLAQAGDEVAANKTIRAVVLTGSGDHFCAGIDMSMFQQQDVDLRTPLLTPLEPSPANLFQRCAYVWREVPVPVICAIRGVAYGGGMQIAAGADIRYVAPDARLSIMEIKWGLIPDMAITTTLRGLVPLDKLKELAFTGAVLGASEAEKIGLVTAVHDDPLAAAHELAKTVAGKSPDAIRAGKKLLNEAWSLPEAEALALEAKLQLPLLGSPNQVESAMANFEKREPRFKD